MTTDSFEEEGGKFFLFAFMETALRNDVLTRNELLTQDIPVKCARARSIDISFPIQVVTAACCLTEQKESQKCSLLSREKKDPTSLVGTHLLPSRRSRTTSVDPVEV